MPRVADERALETIVEWATAEEEWVNFRDQVFQAHFEPVAEEMELEGEELFRRLGSLTSVLLTAVLEEFVSGRFGEDGTRSPVDAYLARRRWAQKRSATAYLRSLQTSRPTLYEVVAVERDRAVTVRDMILETEPLRVPDTQAAEMFVLWDCFAGRVVGTGRAQRFGVGILPFSREAARMCLGQLSVLAKDLVRRLGPSARPRGEPADVARRRALKFLVGSPMAAIVFTRAFAMWQLRAAEEAPVGLTNTDGETLVLSTVRFPILGSEGEVVAALDGLPEFHRSKGEGFSWTWWGRELPALDLPEEILAEDPRAGQQHLVLGEAEVRDGALRLRVNSFERAQAGRDLLAARLGPLLGHPLTAHEPADGLEDAIEDGPDAPPPDEDERRPTIEEAVVRAHIEQHYRKVLDEKMPTLRNRTPRQAARTKKGRAEVVEWLKGIENVECRRALHTRGRPLDMAWLWKELNIPRPETGDPT